MPKVSVIIPTHNRPELLERALSSVYSQSFTDYEVIVVDDGDAPRAKSSLGEYLKQDDFSYLETKKNQGGAASRNLGIGHASGEYLAFLDDDDEWSADKLQKQVEVLDTHDSSVSLVFTQVKGVDSEDNTLFSRPHMSSGEFSSMESLLSKCPIWTSALMYRKEYADKGYLYDASLKKNQEWDLEIRLLKISRFYVINEPLTTVHIGDAEQMGSASNIGNIVSGYQKFMDKHNDIYKKFPTAHSKRLFHLGCLYFQSNDYTMARSVWRKVLAIKPFHIICIKHYITSFIPILYRFLHRNAV